MKKRIDAKTVFMIFMCVLALIAPLFPFWSFSISGLRLTWDGDLLYSEEYRFGLFGIGGVSYMKQLKLTDEPTLEYVQDVLQNFKNGRYYTLFTISEILSAVLIGLIAVRLIMYVLQICGVKLPAIVEKIVCALILTVTLLLVVLIIYSEFSCEIVEGTYSDKHENDYILKYLFTSVGWYLAVVPGLILGLKGKAPKAKKKED